MLYLLRHEERGTSPVFHTPLTNTGKDNSKKLCELLKEIEIDIIFCSPFLRTLQTIYPYCELEYLFVNCELGLYEFLSDPLFKKEGIKTHNDIYDDNLLSIIDNNYISIVKKSELEYPESVNSLMDRTNKVVKSLKNIKNHNILIVSHLSTINAIIKNIIPEHDINTEFKMGELIQLKLT